MHVPRWVQVSEEMSVVICFVLHSLYYSSKSVDAFLFIYCMYDNFQHGPVVLHKYLIEDIYCSFK